MGWGCKGTVCPRGTERQPDPAQGAWSHLGVLLEKEEKRLEADQGVLLDIRGTQTEQTDLLRTLTKRTPEHFPEQFGARTGLAPLRGHWMTLWPLSQTLCSGLFWLTFHTPSLTNSHKTVHWPSENSSLLPVFSFLICNRARVTWARWSPRSLWHLF